MSGWWRICTWNLNIEKLQRERDEGPPASVFSPKHVVIHVEEEPAGVKSWTQREVWLELWGPIPFATLSEVF